MRTIILYGSMLLLFLGCKAQEKITVRYISHQYNKTKNKSFMNEELIFLRANDTLRINVKQPFDLSNARVNNLGIYYNCHLKEDTVYTIKLKKICVSDIPEEFNSYYKTNVVVNKKECSRFTEIEKDTEYQYKGNYGKYVDIDGVLYEIIGLTPNEGCIFR